MMKYFITFLISILLLPHQSYAVVDPFSFPFGEDLQSVKEYITDSGETLVSHDNQQYILETTFFSKIFEEQNSLLTFDEVGKLSAINIQIWPEPASNGKDIIRLYDTVAEAVIDKLGAPSWEESTDGIDQERLLSALSNGDVSRMMQWNQKPTVRLGIPQRIDEDVVIEIVITNKPLARNETFWGGEQF